VKSLKEKALATVGVAIVTRQHLTSLPEPSLATRRVWLGQVHDMKSL